MGDSDGDGQSNGLELGDPNCDWTLGATPARAVDISHPGFSDSTTLAFVDSPISEPTSAPPIAPTPVQEAPAVPTPEPAPTPGSIDSTTSAVGAVPTQPTPAPTSESTAAPTPVQEAPAVPTPEPSPTPLLSSPVPTPTPCTTGSPSECVTLSSAWSTRPVMLAVFIWMVLVQW